MQPKAPRLWSEILHVACTRKHKQSTHIKHSLSARQSPTNHHHHKYIPACIICALSHLILLVTMTSCWKITVMYFMWKTSEKETISFPRDVFKRETFHLNKTLLICYRAQRKRSQFTVNVHCVDVLQQSAEQM